MSIILTVVANDSQAESNWVAELKATLGATQDIGVESFLTTQKHGQVVFVDSAHRSLDQVLDKLDRRGRAVFLLVNSGDHIPKALSEGRVDDVLVYPFRTVEVLGKLQHYQQILMWDEVSRLNASFSDVVTRLHDDLKLAERLQKGKLPIRFSDIKGFKINHRFMAGMRAGGDHFDLAESRDSSQISIVMSDSSSYGLSSAVLSVLMRVAMKLSVEESRSSQDTVHRIYDELKLTLGEKDQLSLFYGVISRKDYRLKYVNLGTSSAFYSAPGEGFRELPPQGGSISKNSDFSSKAEEAAIVLNPMDRIALISDGFVEAMGGSAKTCLLLDRYRQADSIDALNELVFSVKSSFKEPDDLPAQDCTAVIFDLDQRMIRLAR